ncbi:MAG: ABC transporter permease [Armatimonadota bacterium]
MADVLARDAIRTTSSVDIRRRPKAWHRFWGHRLAVAGACIILTLIMLALLAPVLAPYDPEAISLEILAPPSTRHWLGTDEVGRDLISRLLSAARISLTVGIASSILTVILGVTIGAVAGYAGGRVDALISAGINIKLAIPLLPLALVLASFLETNLIFVVLIIGLLSWGGVARIIRAEFLSLKEREFVQAALATGGTARRIVVHHILPNTLAPIIVAATLQMATAILLESALSYLGFGIQPPQASWGNMLQNAQRYLRTAPAMAIYPGALISLTVMSINFAGDGLRDALDPRLRV